MKKLLVGLFLISSIVAFSDVQTVPYEKIVTRGDSNIVYIEGQQAPFTGVVEKKFPNGKVEAKMSFKDGKLHGRTVSYYQNGNMKSDENFVNGIADGVSKSFYENGKVEYETTYKNNKRDGLEKSYSSTGQLQTEMTYKNGKLEGLSKIYGKNGKLEGEAYFKDGQPEGITKDYYPNGIVKSEGNYLLGAKHGASKIYYESGKLQSEATFKNGVLDGLQKDYTEDGKLLRELPYKYNQVNGLAKFYNEQTGKLEYETNYIDNVREGISKKYYPSGKLLSEVSFKKDKEEGLLKAYYENGKPQGEIMNPMLAEQIFSAIENKKTIRSGSKTIYVTGEYEPIFAFQKDENENKKIIIRNFTVLSPTSRYFTLKNGVSNIEKFHKMSDAEWEIMNTLTDGTRKGTEYLNEISGKLFDEIKEVLSKYEIPIAKVTENYGTVNIFVEEGNGKNKLQVTISCLEESIRTDDGYFIPKKNKKLQREISEDFQKYADAQIIELEYRMYVGFKAKQLKSDDIVLVINRNEFLAMADIIDEKYSEKVNINVNDKIKKVRKIGVDINISSVENELFSVNFNIEGIDEKDVETVLESVRNEEKFVTLSSGELVKIANRSTEEMVGIVDAMNDLRIGENKISKIKALQLAQVSSSINKELNEIEEFKQLFQKIKKRENKEPSNIKVKLFPYQQIGFNWLKNMYDIGFGGILADDMGLGKTLQAISLISEIQLENEDLLGIIIVPTSLLHNWKEEFYKFSDIKPILVEGNAETRKELIEKTERGILITTYQTFRNDVKNYNDKKFDVAILDEAQNIKNVSSLVKKATSKLKSTVNFALTGTPIENSIMELWSIFDFILPGYLDNITKFRKKYKNSLNNPDSKKIFNLKNIVSPFILRRTKNEVLTELPEKVENNMIVELSKEQKKLYMAYVKRAKKELRGFNKEENNNLKVLAILTKLRQICNSPQLFDENYTGEVAKIELLREMVPDILENGHRMIIFSQFLGTLEEIKEELKKENVEYFYIDGSVKSKERMEISKKFNSGEGQVVLISLKAGGTGLNLIGADVVIHYDPWWNFAVENQASDRAHRIGQKKSVQVIKLITEGTIEEKIIKIQENKRALSENILGKDSGNNKDSKEIFEMDEKELMELLSFEK